MKKFITLCALVALTITSGIANAAVIDFEAFIIRNANNPPNNSPTIIENVAGDGFEAHTPEGGQKVGYGTNAFDGLRINQLHTVNFDKISGKSGVVPYLNLWVTDGIGNFAIISSENDYRNTDFSTRQEWKVFETNTGLGELDWLLNDAGIISQYLVKDYDTGPPESGIRVNLSDFNNSITLADPGVYPSPIGGGAPKGGFGFNVIFGDTQSNYTGSFSINNLTVTTMINGNEETYLAGNVVPEPATMAIWGMLSGFGVLLGYRKRKLNTAA